MRSAGFDPMLVRCLAPGDRGGEANLWPELSITTITSPEDPAFVRAYAHLEGQFAASDEIETPDVLAERMLWQPEVSQQGLALLYRLILVEREGEFVAVRDHTAMMPTESPSRGALVHLSHLLVASAWRRSGVAAWMRALPVATGRECLERAGISPDLPVDLVAEMEHPNGTDPMRMLRLRAYEKAGFVKVDPRAVDYHQPDFRPPEEIDASGGAKPLPFGLLLRRVGREEERSLSGAELRWLVETLYRMYALGFRRSDMEPLFHSLASYPSAQTPISLVPPSL